MPLDGKEIDFDIALKPDLTRPSLEALAYILRHKEEWPKGHIWDFGVPLEGRGCGTAGCAIGVGRLRWGRIDGHLQTQAGFPGFEEIFCTGAGNPLITPEVVASRIEDHLAGRAIRYLVEGDRG